jgi:glycosyltransferase involved in cell wall biosynthesis
MDGGSSDGTLELLQRRTAPWRIVVSEPDAGVYYAMNKGIALSTGEVIGFLNADDFYPHPEVLSSVAAVFRDPRVDASFGDLCYVKQHHPSQVVRYWRAGPHRPGAFADAWVPPHPTFCVRRSLLERCGGFNTHYRIAADFDLMLRLLEVEQVRTRYLPSVLVHMRLGGMSNRNLANVNAGNREILSALRAVGQRVSTLRFLFYKTLRRFQQYASRPPAT